VSASVMVALRVAATPERAFEVFTRDIGSWWRASPAFQITPRGDGTLAFEPGEGGRLITTLANGKVFEIGAVLVWEPGRRLAFTWRQASFGQDMATEVEVLFEPVGAETRVSVTHRGWQTVPAPHAARHGMGMVVFHQHAADWWRGQLRALAERA
jgi:uncharacterized protein YndB with AHSA1/START domain